MHTLRNQVDATNEEFESVRVAAFCAVDRHSRDFDAWGKMGSLADLEPVL